MWAHVNAVISGLIIGLVLLQLGEGARVQLARVRKDTRDIASDKFKPLQSASPIVSKVEQESNPDQNLYQESAVRPSPNTFAPRWPGPHRTHFPEPGPSMNFPSSNLNSPFGADRRLSAPSSLGPKNLGPRPFADSNFPNFPLRIRTVSHLTTSEGFDGPPLMQSVLGGSPINNFTRSESFSYDSDGVGPPRTEWSYYDSRLGYGQTRRNF